MQSLWRGLMRWSGARWLQRGLTGLALFWCIDRLVYIWTQSQWFASLGFSQIWWQRCAWQVGLFSLTFGVTLCVAFIPFRVLLPPRHIRRVQPPNSFDGLTADENSTPSLLDAGLRAFNHYARRVIWSLLIFFTLAQGWKMAAAWSVWMEFFFGGSTGLREPYWKLESGFYLFRLPALVLLHATLWKLVTLLWGMVALLWLGQSLIQIARRPLGFKQSEALLARVSITGRRWTGALGALWFVLLTAEYVLEPLKAITAIRHNDVNRAVEALVPSGPTFVDWYVRQPVSLLGAVLALFVSFGWLAFAINTKRDGTVRRARRGSVRTLVFVSAGVYVLPGIASWLIAGLVARFIVEPDEWRCEAPFVASHILLSRAAWQLNTIDEQALHTVPLADSISKTATIKEVTAVSSSQIPLWDEETLRTVSDNTDTPSAVKETLTLDTYQKAGKQFFVGLRVHESIDVHHPSPTSLEVISLTSAGRNGEPLVFERLPAHENASTIWRQTPKDWETSSSSGPLLYGVANHVPLLLQNGRAGVPVQNVSQRLLWAWRLRQPALLWRQGENLSPELSAQDRHLIIERNITRCAEILAPSLTPAGTPSVVIGDGQVFWVLDLLTTSSQFPGALALNLEGFGEETNLSTSPVNVAHDAVKMVVNARTGEIQLYASSVEAEKEPLVAALQRAMPGLIQPFRQMPDVIQQHRHYPQNLLRAQLWALERYHSTSPEVYRDQPWLAVREDVGRVALTPYASPQGKGWFYQGMLLQADSAGVVALLQASNGAQNYGHLRLSHFVGAPQSENALMPATLPSLNLTLPRSVEDEMAEVREEVAEATAEKDSVAPVKWQTQHGKVLLVPLHLASTLRGGVTPDSPATTPIGLLLVECLYRPSSVPFRDAAIAEQTESSHPRLWRVAVGDALRNDTVATVDNNVATAVNRLLKPLAARTGNRQWEENLREALRLHRESQDAAKAGDWSRFGELWQRHHKLLQNLLKASPPAESKP